MNRRSFIKSAALAGSAVALPVPTRATTGHQFTPVAGEGWRVFEVTTAIEIQKQKGVTRAWLPLPSVNEWDWIRAMGQVWQGNASLVRVVTEPPYGASMLYAEWDAAVAAPQLNVVCRVVTQDRVVDLAKRGQVVPLRPELAKLYTSPTRLLPTDGIVRKTALEITRHAGTDLEKARAIYDWIVDNTHRDPKTRGCGIGDIRSMLATGNLGGKCADLNALYVGLARAAGLPARDVYGVRVADSRFGYKSLGKSGDITKAQHCRAEVFLDSYGWVPVDPADVRKVMLEEPPGKLSPTDPVFTEIRDRLFGAWEMNWLAYNFAHDVALPGHRGERLPFLMYPQGETASGLLDCLDPERFVYRLTSREVTGAA
jgi:transglutaminase-like putative cysteine protease